MLAGFLSRLVRRARKDRATPTDLVGARRSLMRLCLWLAAITGTHTAAMMALEAMSVPDALWLTATTLTTVGYGDLSAATAPGRWATVILLYGGGIFVLGKGAADYFDYRAARRDMKRRGRWRWSMKDHLVIANAPARGAEAYFRLLLTQLRETAWGQDMGVVLLSEGWPDGLPREIAELAVHVHGQPHMEDRLQDAAVTRARAVVVLASDDRDPASDSLAFDMVHRLRVDMGVDAPVLVECVDDRNRPRLRRAGANTTIRPVRGYPGMMVRALIAPGSEEILENLFTHRGDECRRYEVPARGVAWGDLACAAMRAGFGTALAYEPADGGPVIVNALPAERVACKAVYLLVKEGREPGRDAVQRLVEDAAAA